MCCRDGEIGSGACGKEIGLEEAFGGVAGEEAAADLNGFGRDVDAGVAGISGEFELGAVSAAVFDDGADVILFYEGVEESRFEFGQPVIAACTRVAAFAVALVPIVDGVGELGFAELNQSRSESWHVLQERLYAS